MSQPHSSNHLCLFHANPARLWPPVVAFLRRGLEAGEHCLYLAEEHEPQAVQDALAAHGLTPDELRQSRQLVIQPASEYGLADAPFSAEQAVAGWGSAAGSALAAGFRGLRLVVDMSWALRSPGSLAQLAEYEARAERFFAGAGVAALYHYNRRRFPEEVLLDALRFHPEVAAQGAIRENTFYLPPDIYLRQDRRAQFYWYLSRLDPGWTPAALSLPVPAPSDKASPWQAARRRRSPPLGAPPPQPERGRGVPFGRRWQVHCLGELRLQRPDGSPVNWNVAKGASRKIRTLFAYLLQRGKAGATTEQLADLLWPEQGDTRKALGRLYHTIHALRRALEPDLPGARKSDYLLIHEGRCYLLLPEETWVDAAAFEQFCYRGERLLGAGDDENALACYLAAEKLYGGELLADIPLAYTQNVDDDWCYSRRYWLQEMHHKLLVGLAGIYRRRGAVQEALDYAGSALAADPCHEAAHCEMMRILHLAGRPDALERQYRTCEQALLRQEGRPPDPETARLYEALHRGGR
ncbi:MAG: MEDS domain-containing protein [Chloroflexi bacterium]|nr:MEDS domain-containing protein [Chloroflexota bacterium]